MGDENFPARIFLTFDEDGECLLAHEEISDFADASGQVKCAIYQLVKKGVVLSSPSFVPTEDL